MLIVDDHPIERQTVAYLIKKEGFDIETVLRDNGQTALDYLIENSVDILFTDIKMPKMDGLQLIVEALKIQPNLKIIIFSGYGEFDYAKRAMSMGVHDYLLKPLVKNEFIDCIRRLINEFKLQKSTDKFVVEKIITDIIYGRKYDKNTISSILNKISGLSDLKYCMALITIEETLSESNQEILDDELNRNFDFCIYISETEYLLVMINKYRQYFNEDSLTAVCERWLNYFTDNLQISTISIFSDIFSDFDLCRRYYKNLQMIRYAVNDLIELASNKPINPYIDLECTMSYLTVFKLICKNNSEYILSNDKHIAEQTLLATCDIIEIIPKNNFNQALVEYMNLIYVCKWMNDDLRKNIIVDILRAEDADNIRQIITDAIKINADNSRKSHHNSLEALENIQSFISNNLDKDLSLNILAGIVNYSPNYLSGLFSEHIEMTITQYITKLRIEKAMALLKGSEFKIKKIGKMIGYDNTSYFNKIFKNYCGSTPKEYRLSE